ncbi:AAA family ATPase [Streptomyces sp. NPDC088732]|uniref:helix-turn-helix transcriptional regulator n=1 Tax=Streptomyces sp. NPDC088732 TaxID=3365879 RepID=UPI003800DB2D
MTAGPQLVERDEETRTLSHVLAEARRGSGAAGLVLGAAGSGKSALVHALCEEASATGFTVLKAVASEAEQGNALGVADQLFRYCPTVGAELRRQTALLTAHDSDSHPAVPVLQQITQDLLDRTPAQPLLICVDDVHFADELSVRWLAFLLRRLSGSGVALILTEQTTGQQRSTSPLNTVLRATDYQRVLLAPLSEAGVARLLASRGPRAVRLDPRRVLALSGGNPLLVHALATDAQLGDDSPSADGEADGPGSGYAYSGAVMSCLHQAGRDATAVARGRAVLGEDLGDDLLAEVLRLPADTVRGAVRDLENAGLLSKGRFRHPALRTAVLRSLRATDSGQLHQRAAQLLHGHGAGDRQVVDHLLAGDAPDDGWGAAFLCEAARKAAQTGAGDFARICAEHAYDMSADRAQRGTALTLLAGIAWQLPTAGGAGHFTRLAEAFASDRLDGQASATAAKYLLRTGLAEAAGKGLAALPSTGFPDLHTAAELRTVQAQLALSYPGIPGTDRLSAAAGGGHQGGRGLSLSVRADPTVQAAGLLTQVLRGRADAFTLRGAEQVLYSTRVTQDTWEQADFALLSLLYSERLAETERGIRHLLDQAATVGAEGWRSPLLALRAEVALRTGRLRAAERYAQESLAHCPTQGHGVTAAMALATLVMAQTALGSFDAAADTLSRPVPPEVYQTRYGLHYVYARGEYRLATQHTSAALEDFLICGDLMAEWDMDRSSLVPWRTSAAKAHLREGRQRRAKVLIDTELRRSGPAASRGRGVALRVSAGTTELRNRPSVLRQAVDELQHVDNPVELAQALLDLGQTFRGLGDHKRSRVMMIRASHLALESGATPITRALTDLVPDHGTALTARSGGVTSVPDVLSDAERRVASLAVMGHTNREIAKDLFITVSTVEQHLTRVYRKLNVSRRSDLPAALIAYRAPVARTA